jgi:signal transduction histidine kinase
MVRPPGNTAGERNVASMTERMWRVAAIFRVITMLYATLLIVRDHDEYAHPAAGLAVLAVLIGWTAITVTAYARPPGRTRWLIAADVVVAAALVLSTRWIDSPARISEGMPTLPALWAAAPVLACAVAGGSVAGIAGALAISAADLAERPELTQQNPFSSIVLLLIAGGIGGYVVRLGVQAEEAVGRVARKEAAIAERDRIARGIHDSVLQVLTLVSSRGQALGGAAAELGRLAAEQESALRRLVTSSVPGPAISLATTAGSTAATAATGTAGTAGTAGTGTASDSDTGDSLADPTDLRELVEQFSDPQVTVSCPATPVLLPGSAAQALGGATAAALDNVRRHAGGRARAWVLVEDQGATVRVSVRDDGNGFAGDRLAQATAAGRLGVAQSIVGRIRAAGGSACVTSAPGQGTEVELAIPRR